MPALIQVTDREMLNVYKREYDASGTLKSSLAGGVPYTQQLLVNYCFGHDASSILLCPATNANLVNHCSTRMKEPVGQCNPSLGPNAKLQWALEFDPETPEWLTQDIPTINERVKNGRRGLSLELVALRSIEAHEEIFIDFGRSWEETWDEHVATWNPPEDDGGFIPVSDMNLDVEKHLLTKSELDNGSSYAHKNVRIGCYVLSSYHPCEVLEKKKDGDTTYYSVKIR